MALGNKGFADLVSAPLAEHGEIRRLPRMGILGGRENRLAELAAGKITTRIHESVDPGRCKIWDYHNRDYQALDTTSCSDLIESFRAQGRQEVPAIVRRLKDDPLHEFEVICGARRHWSVSWLRAHDRPDFTYLIEVRELNDEEAFRLADLENRQRKDLSDFERATDYARAIERYYEGSQQRMADRLDVTKSWLSRYLDLARLPPEVVGAFGSPHSIGISHAAALAPRLRDPTTRDFLLEEASALAGEQAARRAEGGHFFSPAIIIARLLGSQKRKANGTRRHEAVVAGEHGKIAARATIKPNGAILVEFGINTSTSKGAMIAALRTVLEILDSPVDGKSRRKGRGPHKGAES